ncbi:MAG: putative photosynthetic complex assembly protein PuhE [Geminicoccaceae bacterium]
MDYAYPALFALFLWWLSTGVIFSLIALPRQSYRWTLTGASLVAFAALWVLVATRDQTGLAAVYLAFTAAICVWAWHEISFLTGLVTGPAADRSLSPRRRGWPHFVDATSTVIYHELAIALTLLLVGALTWNHANQLGLWTFALLWVMRLSAKFNLFLGVPRPHEELLPDHLTFLRPYLAKARMNWLFPISVTIGTLVLALLVGAALQAVTVEQKTVYALLATLLALALLEHWFLVLPVKDSALWRWFHKTNGVSGPERSSPTDKSPHRTRKTGAAHVLATLPPSAPARVSLPLGRR